MSNVKKEEFREWLINQGYAKSTTRNYPYRAERLVELEGGSLKNIIASYHSAINNPSGNKSNPIKLQGVSIKTLKAHLSALKKYDEFCKEIG